MSQSQTIMLEYDWPAIDISGLTPQQKATIVATKHTFLGWDAFATY